MSPTNAIGNGANPTPPPVATNGTEDPYTTHGYFYRGLPQGNYATGAAPFTVNMAAIDPSGNPPFVKEVFFLHQCAKGGVDSSAVKTPQKKVTSRWGDIVTVYPAKGCTVEMRMGGGFGTYTAANLANRSQVLTSIVNMDLTGTAQTTTFNVGPVAATGVDNTDQGHSSGYRIAYGTQTNNKTPVPQPHYIGGFFNFLALNDGPGIVIYDLSLGTGAYPYNMSTVNNYRTYADYNLHGTNFVMPASVASNTPAVFNSGKITYTPTTGLTDVPPYTRLFNRGGLESADTVNVTEDAATFGGDLENDSPKWGNSTFAKAPAGNLTVQIAAQGYQQYVGQNLVKLFDMQPRDTTNPNDLPIISLAQLQHASLTADDDYIGVGYQPGYAVGNSWSTPYVQRNLSIDPERHFSGVGGPNPNANTNFFDISYLLNTALFDRYFFSAIPQTDARQTVDYAVSMNPRYKFANGYKFGKGGITGYTPLYSDLGMYATASPKNLILDPAYNQSGTTAPVVSPEYVAAESLAIDGAFNVNSTSKDAWFAFLSGLNGMKYLNSTLQGSTADSVTTGVPFPRSLRQVPDSTNVTDLNFDPAWTGYRRLTVGQLNIMATNMVDQVRMRGPFLSLAQFVNRSLNDADRDKGTDPQDAAVSGALQYVIDPPSVTDNLATRKAYLQQDYGNNPINVLTAQGHTLTTSMTGLLDKQLMYPGLRQTMNSQDAFPDYSKPAAFRELGDRSTGIPGWLTQADILQVLGPVMAARSDTFVVRAYGEVLDQNDGSAATANPVNPVILGRAWCEAVVQRFPDYVDPVTNQPSDSVAGSYANGGHPMAPVNLSFGRKFRVVSFRWLSPSDI